MFRRIPTTVFARISLGVGAIFATKFGLDQLVLALAPQTLQDSNGFQLGQVFVGVILAFLAYAALYRWLEQRQITELALRPMARHMAFGLVLGSVLLGATVAVVALVGNFTIVAVNPLAAMLPAVVMALRSAAFEELLFRGVLMRILNQRFGSWPALMVSGLVFGGLHMMNPGASWVSALSVVVEAGILLGVAYLYSGTLWLPIGIHFGWNFMQAGVFSLSVSGVDLPAGLLGTTITGPVWATGGAFGIEQSVQAVGLSLIASAALYYAAKRKGWIVKARWRNIR